jgi:hypothetical protein
MAFCDLQLDSTHEKIDVWTWDPHVQMYERIKSYLSCWWHHTATPSAQPQSPAIGPNSATSRTPVTNIINTLL